VLYRAFKDWCKQEGEEIEMTNKAFTEAMEIRGHTKKRTNQGAMWQQVMIIDKNAGERRGDGW
jgi:phage/plasmid-associated DNA primase